MNQLKKLVDELHLEQIEDVYKRFINWRETYNTIIFNR